MREVPGSNPRRAQVPVNVVTFMVSESAGILIPYWKHYFHQIQSGGRAVKYLPISGGMLEVFLFLETAGSGGIQMHGSIDTGT